MTIKMRPCTAKLLPDFRAVIAASLLLLGAGRGSADQAAVAPAMQGRWEGCARVDVSWCQQTNLAITLDIHPDGTVAGKIGDARLRHGWIEPNRGGAGHLLSRRSDYIIHGSLKGAVVAAENITRPRVAVALNFGHGVFTGSVETSGTVVGDKKTKVLSADSLKLTRLP
jgi:hypothetical protein